MLSSHDRGPALAQDSSGYRTVSTPSMTVPSVFLPYAQFQIPFNVDTTGAQPSAVQLMVSTDGGRTWQQQGRANPGDRHFDFRAAAEGEYLFTVQTVDAAGIAFPSPNPPMRVQVDTTKPQAAVRADLDHGGNLIVDLRVADDHIDLKSAVLKIRTDRDPQWREVPVTTLSAVSGYYEGQVEVLIPACREIAIVFSISDQAKNSVSASYLFTMPRTANQPSDLQLASSPGQAEPNTASAAIGGSSQSSTQSLPGAVPWDLNRNVAAVGNLANTTNATANGSVPTKTPSAFAQQPGLNANGSSTVRPANPNAGGYAVNQAQPAASSRQGNYPTTPRGSNLNALAQIGTAQSGSVQTGNPQVLPSGTQAAPSQSNTATQVPNQPYTAQQFAAQQQTGQSLAPQANPSSQPTYGAVATQPYTQGPGQLAKANLDLELRPTNLPNPEELSMPTPVNPQGDVGAVDRNRTYEQSRAYEQQRRAPVPTQAPAVEEEHGFKNPYYCKSRTFSLDYSVEALGGNALSEVELWGTEDNGRTWEKWGSDPDRVSPFDVKVGNDGLFGFRMVLVGPGGSVLGNPKPGDDADAWIRVDSELPQCKITRALYGVGSEAGMLVIDYNCSDSDLADEGITLSWSSTVDGPWTPFASAIKNTGLYLWKADASLPSRVFLKLEAVDKAGNTGVHRMDLPIDTKGLSPRGRIQGIRPITGS